MGKHCVHGCDCSYILYTVNKPCDCTCEHVSMMRYLTIFTIEVIFALFFKQVSGYFYTARMIPFLTLLTLHHRFSIVWKSADAVY